MLPLIATRRPPSRPKKKRHTMLDEPDNDDDNGMINNKNDNDIEDNNSMDHDNNSLGAFLASPEDHSTNKNTKQPPVRRKIPFADEHPAFHKSSSSSSSSSSKNDGEASSSHDNDADADADADADDTVMKEIIVSQPNNNHPSQHPQQSTTTTTAARPPLPSSTIVVASRRRSQRQLLQQQQLRQQQQQQQEQQLHQQQSSSTTRSTASRRRPRNRSSNVVVADPLWEKVTQLSPAEQVPVYWQLVYAGQVPALPSNNNDSKSSNNNINGSDSADSDNESISSTTTIVAINGSVRSSITNSGAYPLLPSSAQRKPPARGVLKRSHKRSRPPEDEEVGENNDESNTPHVWASPSVPGTSTSMASSSWCTPQAMTATATAAAAAASSSNCTDQTRNTTTTATTAPRSVQFGPSKACTFESTAAVAGSLRPLADAAVALEFSVEEHDVCAEDHYSPEQAAELAETKANMARLKEWDAVLVNKTRGSRGGGRKDNDDDSDSDDDDTFVISQPPRRGKQRRDSTLFSPATKCLLDEEDDDGINLQEDDDDDDDDDDDEINDEIDALNVKVNETAVYDIPQKNQVVELPLDATAHVLGSSSLHGVVHSPTLSETMSSSVEQEHYSPKTPQVGFTGAFLLTDNNNPMETSMDSTTLFDVTSPVHDPIHEMHSGSSNLLIEKPFLEDVDFSGVTKALPIGTRQLQLDHNDEKHSATNLMDSSADLSETSLDGSKVSSPIHKISQSPSDRGEEADDDDSPTVWQGSTVDESGRHSISPNQSEIEEPGEERIPEPAEEEEELFTFDQLILPQIPSKALIYNLLQHSPPLQWFLSQALQTYLLPDSPRILALAPYRTLFAELDLLEELLGQVRRSSDKVAQQSRAEFRGALQQIEAIRPKSGKDQIANLEAEIALLEEDIIEQQEALACKRQRELKVKLTQQDHHIQSWHALSGLLANLELPEADETCPVGFCYKYPIPLLGNVVVLRPSQDVTTDSASLDEVCSVDTLELPGSLVTFFRSLVSTQLSAVLDWDFEPAARFLTTFLGRLDRSLDDLQRACRLWQHSVDWDETDTANDDTSRLLLEFQFQSRASVRLIWDVSSYQTATWVFPSKVELQQYRETQTVPVECHPPTFRHLWNQLVDQVRQNE